MIEAKDLSFVYRTGEADAVPALWDQTLEIAPGQLVAIMGHNGSGKSTLAKLLCAILYPTEGELRIDGVPVREENQWEVRRKVAVLFQDPDDQLVMNRVEDDGGVGPENPGLPRGRPVRRGTQGEVRRKVAVVSQDPDDQLVMNRVEDDVAFGPENLGLPREEISERVGASLEALGLEEIQGRLVEDLSPGQKQRVAIAGALAMRPRVPALGEPTPESQRG